MYTTHGHQIPDTTVDLPKPPVARCGGPGFCSNCSQEVAAYINSQKESTTPVVPEETSGLIIHARRELASVGEDDETIEQYISVIRAFSNIGPSGSQAAVMIPVINELLQFKNLTDLTDDPSEWIEVGDGMWQNVRNSEAFSKNGGETYYILSEMTPTHESKKRLT